MNNVTKDIFYVGVNDHQIDLFEGMYEVPDGMAYNSYVIMDEKIAVMDTMEVHFTDEWLGNIKEVLGDRKPDYLIVQHMEPDHSSSIKAFMEEYPEAVVIGNKKTFTMMYNFYGVDYTGRNLVVDNGTVLDLGTHKLTFIIAPMVHWPEVMLTYDAESKVIFSADAFGKFGALDVEQDWDCEARRYYFGIVGKYGPQVQNLLCALPDFQVETICPLHGPVLTGDLSHYIRQYYIWSSYGVETEGVVIAYTSVYGNTRKAVEYLEKKLLEMGCPRVEILDLARRDMSENVETAFRYGKIVFATTTYNGDIFPFMHTFIHKLVEREYQNKTIGLIENGSWAPAAARVMKGHLEGLKKIKWLETTTTILSGLKDENYEQLDAMAAELMGQKVVTAKAEVKGPVYTCACGHQYDPAKGDPDSGIAPGTPFEDLPDDWCCPICGLSKDMFTEA